jgi:hypothetical protein
LINDLPYQRTQENDMTELHDAHVAAYEEDIEAADWASSCAAQLAAEGNWEDNGCYSTAY